MDDDEKDNNMCLSMFGFDLVDPPRTSRAADESTRKTQIVSLS